MAKRSNRRKNSRRLLAGLPVPEPQAPPPPRIPDRDLESDVLAVMLRLKEGGDPEVRVDLRNWKPPGYHCGKCLASGPVTDCGRMFDPAAGWQWICGCGEPLVARRDYLPHWQNPARTELHEGYERAVKDEIEKQKREVAP